jgi:hypothetical protein
MWRLVVHWRSADISEDHIASIFWVQEYAQKNNQRESRWQLEQATCSSETSVGFQRTTRRQIPENRTLEKKVIMLPIWVSSTHIEAWTILLHIDSYATLFI